MEYIFTFIVSLVITMLLVPPLMKLAPIIGAIDLPDSRKVHQGAIPRTGGIAMIVGAIVPMVLWLPMVKETYALLGAFIILLIFGVWDDRVNLHYKIKFFGQLLAVIVVVVAGDVVVYHVPFLQSSLPYYIAAPLTVFALVGITNAINLSDGLDGLAGGTSLLTFCMIAFLGYKSDNSELVLICLSVAGAIMGFLRHNTYPARIFMGDTGSQFLGFSVGVLVIVLSQQVNLAMSPVVPLILLGLPILDTVAVMGQRIYEKRSPFSPDKNHIHHKLLDIGFDHYEAVFIIYLVQTALVSMAFFMRYEADWLIFLIYLGFSVCALYLFHYARTTGWEVHTVNRQKTRNRSWVHRLFKSEILHIIATQILKICIPALFIFAMYIPDKVNTDIGVLSIGLFATILMANLITHKVTLLEKIAVYVTCALGVFLLDSGHDKISEYSNYLNAYLLLIALAFAIKIQTDNDRSFQVTPLDFLVILFVLVVPNLAEFSSLNADLGESAVKLILLFYTSEAVLNIVQKKYDVFRLGVLVSLLIGASRGLLG